MSKNAFKSTDRMTQKEFIDKFLPADHNDQDKIYLEKRYQWETGQITWNEHSDSYQGTTFEKKYNAGILGYNKAENSFHFADKAITI